MKELLLFAALLAPGQAPPQLQSGVITGQLLSKGGQPAAGIRVSAMEVPEANTPAAGASTLASIALTDNAGRYRLENVPRGRYYIVAGFVDSPTYFPGVSSMNDAKAVEVSTGATVSDVNFTMVVSAGVTVSGRLIRPANAPPATTRRLLLRGGTAPVPETTANADGSFQFTRVRPGNYQLMITAATLAQPLNIVVADQDITGLEAVVVLMVPVRANVVVDDDGLRPRFSLTFSPFKGGVNTATLILATGTVSIQLPEGQYRVGWSGLPPGYEVKSIMSGSVDLLSTPLFVASGTPVPPIVVTLGISSPPPWVKVSGRVTGSSEGVLRLTFSGGAVDSLEAPVNPDGSFEFARVLPGVYTARVTPPLPIPPISVTVPNRDLTGVEVAIPFVKEIIGYVEGPETVSVRMMFTLNSPPGAPFTPPTTSTTTSGAGGGFRITLPEGERRVTLNVPGFVVQSLTYGTTDLLREPLKISRADSAELRVMIARPGTGVFAGPGGIVGGVVGGVPPPLPPPVRAASVDPAVAQANLVFSVSPVHPPLAQAAGVRGIVMLLIVISVNGTVDDVRVLSGHPLLNDAAIEAVRQWRYRPQLVTGQPSQPAAVQTTVSVNIP